MGNVKFSEKNVMLPYYIFVICKKTVLEPVCDIEKMDKKDHDLDGF